MNRKILASLLVIGIVGATAAGSTFALFNDTETSEDNTFTAGALDLKVDYTEFYNDELVDSSKLTDNPGTIFDLEDIKPGDQGNMTLSLHVNDNPGYVWMKFNQTEDLDNTCTEPEADAEGDCGTEGELDDEMDMALYMDENGDQIRQDGEKVLYEGSAANLTEEAVLLDADSATNGTQPFDPEKTYYVGVDWNLPRETGNIAQTDSFEVDAEFFAEQARHNDNPQNPFN